MAFTFTIQDQWVEGSKRYARGTWDSSAGTDVGGTINTPLTAVEGFDATIDQDSSYSVNAGAALTDIDILHAAAVRSGTWVAWGS